MAAPNPIATIQSYNWQEFDQTYRTLLQQHEEVVRTGRMNQDALETAERLATAVEDLRQRLTWTASPQELEEFLTQGEPLFPVALRMSGMVADNMVQCFERYVDALSRPTRDLMNISVFQCDAREQRVSNSSVEEVRGYLRDVIKTRSYDQCETEFSLKCAYSATKKLEIGKGKWREVRNRHRGELAEGLVGVILSASPLPPFISLAPLAPPVMHLCADIYNETKDKWYGAVSIMMFEQGRGILRNAAAFRTLKNHFIKQKHENYKIHLYLTTLFREMLNECRHVDDEDLKAEIIYANDISLKTIVSQRIGIFSSSTRNQSKFGRVRYNALKILGNVQDSRGISQLILERIGEKHEIKEVKGLAKSLLKERPLPQGQELQQFLEAVSRLREQLSKEGGVILGQVNEGEGEIIANREDLEEKRRLRESLGDVFEHGVGDGIDPEELDYEIVYLQRELQKQQDILNQKKSELEELQDNQAYLSGLVKALETGTWEN